jgi:hypothetical protein
MSRPGFGEHLAKATAGGEVFEMPGSSRGHVLKSLA